VDLNVQRPGSFLDMKIILGSVHFNCNSAQFQALWKAFNMLLIIESVDSICRDSADTQYMLIQTNVSKSPKQLTYKPL